MDEQYIIQPRYGAEDDLNAYTGIIYDREFVIERSNDGHTRLKIGDGTTLYADLPYINIIVKHIDIELPSANWIGDEAPYSQEIEIPNVTVNNKVDIQLTPKQLMWVVNTQTYFTIKNTDGVITVYAVGNKPTEDFIIDSALGALQITII